MQEVSIESVRVREHYEIYVNGSFEQSCDISELGETLEEIQQRYKRVQ